jgi:uncharacterized protein YcfL
MAKVEPIVFILSQSIETVRVDGSGRYSFLEFFKRRRAQSLAVFERWFYWTDQMGLWRSPQDRPNQKTFIQRTTLPVLEAYHEQQQPKGMGYIMLTLKAWGISNNMFEWQVG